MNGGPMNGRLCKCSVVLAAFSLLTGVARASFHLWRINEIYSTADGSVQFVEFFLSPTSFDQRFLAGHPLTCVNAAGTQTNTLIFPSNLPSAATSGFFLVATPGFASLPGGITPDYTMPTNFLFAPGGQLNFAGVDVVTYTNLPTDGVLSISRTGATATNSPSNFAGQSGSIRPPNIPPTVALTNPPNNSAFAAPATLTLQAAAGDPDGSVTNVQFFSDGTLLGAVSAPPFDLAVSNLADGNYIFTARATDNLGLMATSAPVSISVVTPVELRFSPPTLVNGQFRTTLSTTPGLTYVVETATNLPAFWTGFSTNMAASNSLSVVDPNVTNCRQRLFRAFIRP